MKKKKTLFVFKLIILFSSPLLAMDIDDIPRGKILIKSVNSGTYVKVQYNTDIANNSSGEWSTEFSKYYRNHPQVSADSNISEASCFIIQKNNEGFLIKNTKTNMYLYVEDSIPFYNDNVGRTENISPNNITVTASNNTIANSYFDILKKGDSYVIKNKKYSGYFRALGLVSSEREISERSYFVFKDFPEGLF